MKITEVLPLQGGGILSLVGGGGKTTTLLALAKELKLLGKKVLITTTTKFAVQMADPKKLVLINDEEQLKKWLMATTLDDAILASQITAEQKLAGIPAQWLEDNQELFLQKWDVILVEADGSKGKSIKANLAYEPVIPANSKIVLVVIGMDVLGKPLTEEIAHRVELISEITAMKQGQPIAADGILRLLQADQGLLKGIRPGQDVYLILNKFKSAPPDQINKLIYKLQDSFHHQLAAILVAEMQAGEIQLAKVIDDV